MFEFNEAVSLQVFCDTQEDLDYFWEKLSAGGDPKAQQCGWLKDRYGLSWQIVPSILPQLMEGTHRVPDRAMKALLPMKKLNIATLKRAFDEK